MVCVFIPVERPGTQTAQPIHSWSDFTYARPKPRCMSSSPDVLIQPHSGKVQTLRREVGFGHTSLIGKSAPAHIAPSLLQLHRPNEYFIEGHLFCPTGLPPMRQRWRHLPRGGPVGSVLGAGPLPSLTESLTLTP